MKGVVVLGGVLVGHAILKQVVNVLFNDTFASDIRWFDIGQFDLVIHNSDQTFLWHLDADIGWSCVHFVWVDAQT